MPRRFLFPTSALAFLASVAAAQTSPILTGYVTAIGTPAEFGVDRSQVRCTATTRLTLVHDGDRVPVSGCPLRSLGEAVTVYGKRDKTSGIITAVLIESAAPADREVEGFAVIDRIVTAPDASGSVTVSADGYSIAIPSAIHAVFLAPLTEQTAVTTNLWLKYSGTQHLDGSVTAKTATFSSNTLKDRERKANQKVEFDPSSVTEEDKQGNFSKAFKGIDPKRFPAVHDSDMQERVEKIGAKLIPAYQRDLRPDDPSRIDFRFQVVDQPKLRDALTLSNGIILVPQQVIKRLQNDSQVATVLADNIACALEKQTLRLIPARRAEAAGNVAAIAGGLFVPGLGFAGPIQAGTAETVMKRRDEEQSGRVSLVLLRQAGYDMAEAPKTWWILGSSKEKPLDEIGVPYRAKYLYRMLGTTWRQSVSDSLAALPVAQ
jgi:hypothetical protein